MTSSTLASLSKGFAELSTDDQFLQLRTKQIWSRRITGVSDGIKQGTEALAQGFAFGVSGVVTKPVESARQNGILGLAHGLGRAVVGFIVQPVSGVLDFFSLTVDGIGASCSRCVEVFNNKEALQRIRLPRAIHADGVLREYCERRALGQMILHLAEASRHFGCTEIFKEPSKYSLSDYYEEHFSVPSQRIVLMTNKRVMLLQSTALNKLDKKPCKITWDVPWEELMALELAKAGSQQPSHVMLHLKNFKRSENFVRVIKCHIEEVQGTEPQAVRICSVIRKIWKAHPSDMTNLTLKVPSSQQHVCFALSEADGRDTRISNKVITKSRELSSASSSVERKFVEHSINFSKIWSSERETKERCSLCKKQASEDGGLCSIWRPICPDGYISIGDIAYVGSHPPSVAAVYQKNDRLFAIPVGYDLVWRNCLDDYTTPLSIWHPRAPEGFISPGCVALVSFEEPATDLVYCIAESLAEETEFEEQKVWSAQDSFPWACHIHQVRSDALHFAALRQPKEESDWKPMRVVDNPEPLLQSIGNP
jgi:vacuolar protein sorting-associated protein 13A/C